MLECLTEFREMFYLLDDGLIIKDITQKESGGKDGRGKMCSKVQNFIPSTLLNFQWSPTGKLSNPILPGVYRGLMTWAQMMKSLIIGD